MSASPFRIEKDSLGERRIPAAAYYGVQTDRARENYRISGLRAHPKFIDAYVLIKKAAALANKDSGALAPEKAEAIVNACDEILAGEWRDQFVVDVFQMGAGTAFHMNVNEVLANRANEILGGTLGTYELVHPNDHVNYGQSTNDTFPAAMRLCALLQLRDHLHEPLVELQKAFSAKGAEFDGLLKSGRTHLQDAAPIRLGQEFTAYGEATKKCREFLNKARESLLELGIGGSAVGTGLNTVPGYRTRLINYLRDWTKLELKSSPDLCEAMQSQRPIAETSAALRNLALELTRICNDLRLLSSGPTTGVDEIHLPGTAPGSSIMPGKINPSILEMTNMVCFQVVGCDATIALAVQAGQLEVNVMMPVMIFNLTFMIEILGNAVVQLRSRCVEGITANEARLRHYAESTLALATLLNPIIGYNEAAEVVKDARATGKSIMAVICDRRILSEEEITRLFELRKLTTPPDE